MNFEVPDDDIPDEMLDAARSFSLIRDDLDLSGLSIEVIRNWVQFVKVVGLPLDNKTRAIVMLLGAVDTARANSKLWEGHARRLGYDPTK